MFTKYYKLIHVCTKCVYIQRYVCARLHSVVSPRRQCRTYGSPSDANVLRVPSVVVRSLQQNAFVQRNGICGWRM